MPLRPAFLHKSLVTGLVAGLAVLAAGSAVAQQPPAAATLPPPSPQKQYLVENAKKPGWMVTASGLQYHVVKRVTGNAPRPLPTDTVVAHYRGTLIDGREFDSSYSRGQPATFGINKLIPGWREGIPMMRVGEVWEFAVPSELGYGSKGAGDEIAPGATLLFTVELLQIKKPQEENLLDKPAGLR